MNIAFIGGSITEGTGASVYSNSYVYKLEKYFKKKYKKADVRNLGSSSTSSHFGLFRLNRDLKGFKPDIIFIEFAVNDRIYNPFDITLYFENLIRECSKITKRIIIIDLPTKIADSCTSIHKKAAYFYNIPLIDVQDEVSKMIGMRKTSWTKISIDNIHPNDAGHDLYYSIIKENLEKIDIDKIDLKIDRRTLCGYTFFNPRIEKYDSQNINYYGNWNEENFNLINKIESAAVTMESGSGVIFDFKGRNLHMINILTRDSGILKCQLDNERPFYVDLYKCTEACFEITINLINLKDCIHELTMTVCEKSNEKSCGTKAIIGGFLVDE